MPVALRERSCLLGSDDNGTTTTHGTWRQGLDAGRLIRAGIASPILPWDVVDETIAFLSSQLGPPTGRFGEAVMAHGVVLITDVVDAARA